MLHEIAKPEDLITLEAQMDVPAFQITSALDLYLQPFNPPRALIDGLLYEGLTLLTARPKAGKSWLVLQLAIAASGGGGMPRFTFNDRGTVLYYALEESTSRTQLRLRKLAPMGDWAANLKFIYSVKPLMQGGAEDLQACINQVRPRIVVIDTFTALVRTSSQRNADVFRSQYAEIDCLRKIAQDSGVAMIVVHHTRKAEGDDVVDSVSGTHGIAAAADSIWSLKRSAQGEGKLEVTGRELEHRTWKLRFTDKPFGWTVADDHEKAAISDERNDILEDLRLHSPSKPRQIADRLVRSEQSVRMMLSRMVKAGQVQKVARSSYSITRLHCYNEDSTSP